MLTFFCCLLTSLCVHVCWQHLTRGCFSDPYLATRHPRDGRTMKELWHEHWAGNYEQLNSFHDHDACVKVRKKPFHARLTHH